MWVLSPYSLPCGLVSADLPHAWDLVEESYYDAAFQFEDGRMMLKAMSYERPDIVESGNYAELFWDFLSEEHFNQMERLLDRWWTEARTNPVILSDREQAEDGTWYRNVWRQVQVLPPHHVRRLTWRFEPAAQATGKDLEALTEALHEVVIPRTLFAKEKTPLDRVAPSPALKLISLSNSILMRVPPHWKLERENEDGSGRYLIDEPQQDRWTLWFDWNRFSSDNPPEDEAAQRELIARNVEIIVQVLGKKGAVETKPGLGLDRIVVRRVHDEEDGLHVTDWHRVALSEGRLFVVHLSFNVTDTEADKSDVLAVRDLIERELINAVLVPEIANREDG